MFDRKVHCHTAQGKGSWTASAGHDSMGDTRVSTSDSVAVCVIGAGTMGRGIAQVALAAGHRVNLVDPVEAQLEAAGADVSMRLARRHPEIASTLDTRFGTYGSVENVPASQRT